MDGWLNIVLIFFHILIIPEHWVLPKSRIPAQLVLGGVRIVALSISSHKQALLFSYIDDSLYIRRIRFPDYLFCVLCPV